VHGALTLEREATSAHENAERVLANAFGITHHQQVFVAPIKLMTPLSSALAGYDIVKL
jgi:hypothetical protein